MDTCKRMWSKEELAAAGGKVYRHYLKCTDTNSNTVRIVVYSSKSDAINDAYVKANPTCLIGGISTLEKDGVIEFDRLIANVDLEGPPGYFGIKSGSLAPATEFIKINSDTFGAL